MGIKISSLTALTQSGVDIFQTPPQVAGIYGGRTKRISLPYYNERGNYDVITSPSHTFIVGDAVKRTSGGWQLAVASSRDAAEVTGVVIAVQSGKFAVQYSGVAEIGLQSGGRYESALSIGSTYYLSSDTAGLATSTEPTDAEAIVKPVFIPISASEVLIVDDRAVVGPIQSYVEFDQSTPALSVGQAVYKTSTGWDKAAKSSLTLSTAVGVVTKKTGITYRVTFSGLATVGGVSGSIYSSAFTPGEHYYLTTNGAATTSVPASSEYSKLVFTAITATQIYIWPSPPVVPVTEQDRSNETLRWESALTAWPTPGTGVEISHPLGNKPTTIEIRHVCQNASGSCGWALGDEIENAAVTRDDATGNVSISGAQAFFAGKITTSSVKIYQRADDTTETKVIEQTTGKNAQFAPGTLQTDWKIKLILTYSPKLTA